MSVLELLSFDNSVFKAYVFWSGVLAVKLLLMAPLTAYYRFKTMTFSNPEDLMAKEHKIKFDEPSIERVRRAHRNDLENILPFFVVGFLYVLTDPAAFLAINLFRIFTVARIAHTLVYAVIIVPQPARAIAWFAGVAVTLYMTIRILLFAI